MLVASFVGMAWNTIQHVDFLVLCPTSDEMSDLTLFTS